METEAVSADPAIEETETAATVTEPTESDKEPDTSAQTADPSETTEEKPLLKPQEVQNPMSNMRVFELAKEMNLPAKQLLQPNPQTRNPCFQ